MVRKKEKMNINPEFSIEQIRKWDDILISNNTLKIYAESVSEILSIIKQSSDEQKLKLNKLFPSVSIMHAINSFYYGQWLHDFMYSISQDKEKIDKFLFAFGQKSIHTHFDDLKKITIEFANDFIEDKNVLDKEVYGDFLIKKILEK